MGKENESMRTMTQRTSNCTKSYVTLEQNVCGACGKTFDTNALLMDMRLRDTFEHHTVTGFGTCPKCQKKLDDGFILLIEIDPSKSERMPNGNIRPQDAYRTGVVIQVKREVAKNIFNTPMQDISFIDPDVTAKLQSMMPKEEKENKDEPTA